MSQLFRGWFSSDSRSTNSSSSINAEVSELVRILVASSIKSLSSEDITADDFSRLCRTLVDRSVELQSTPTFSSQQRLSLVISTNAQASDWNSNSDAKQLWLANLNCELARWLVLIFPNMKWLEFHLVSPGYELDQAALECLLFGGTNGNWAHQLTRLWLCGQRVDQWRACLPRLTAANFPQLTALSMLAESRLDGGRQVTPLDLPILRQLTCFSVHIVNTCFELIWPTLKEHVNDRPPLLCNAWLLPDSLSPPKRRRFWLGLHLAAPLLYEVLSTIAPHLAAQIRRIQVIIPRRIDAEGAYGSSSPPALVSVAHTFGSLVVLSLFSEPDAPERLYALVQLMRPLVHLTSLRCLDLYLKSYKQLPTDGEQIPPDVKPSAHLTEVSITIATVRHGSVHVPTIVDGLFPAARPVDFAADCCETCVGVIDKPNEDDCYRQVLVDAREGDVSFD